MSRQHELTDYEREELLDKLTIELLIMDRGVVASFLAQYILHKSGAHWQDVLTEIKNINKQGRV